MTSLKDHLGKYYDHFSTKANIFKYSQQPPMGETNKWLLNAGGCLLHLKLERMSVLELAAKQRWPQGRFLYFF